MASHGKFIAYYRVSTGRQGKSGLGTLKRNGRPCPHHHLCQFRKWIELRLCKFRSRQRLDVLRSEKAFRSA